MILFQKLSKKKSRQQESDVKGLISELYRNGLLAGLVDEYLEYCKRVNGEGKQKSAARFANLAGLCRYLGTGLSDLEQLRCEHPEEYDRLLAIFEDEALNASISPTLLSAYVKKRMSYSGGATDTDIAPREVNYHFEHDIYADGE